MKPKQAGKCRDVLMIAGVVVMLLGCIHKAFLVAGLCIAASCLLPHFLFYRCPHCGKLLGRNEALRGEHRGMKDPFCYDAAGPGITAAS